MVAKLTQLVQRTATGCTLAWGLGAMLIGVVIYPHAPINSSLAFFLIGLSELLGLGPRYLNPARRSLLRAFNTGKNLFNLAALALVALLFFGIVLYHF